MNSCSKPDFSLADICHELYMHFGSSYYKSVSCIGRILYLIEKNYDFFAYQKKLYELSSDKHQNSVFDCLVDVYEKCLVPKTIISLRSFYDRILSSARNGKCPYCSQRDVSTVDHYLPKKKNPQFALTPYNLVPACKDCNFAKSDRGFSSRDDQPIHPYYDNFDSSVWISADIVITGSYGTIRYYPNPPHVWPEIDKARVIRHFNLFKLDKLYSANACDALCDIRIRLEDLHRAGGRTAVEAYLKEEAESRFRYDKNSWKSVLYKKIAQSDIFCDGGFRCWGGDYDAFTQM